MPVQLNGWQRLWVVFTVVWTIVPAIIVSRNWQVLWLPDEDYSLLSTTAWGTRFEVFGGAIFAWVVPPITIYLAGVVVRWVYRGFRQATHH